jgi:hypothetical protein
MVAVAAATVIAAALLAAYFPARRAARLDQIAAVLRVTNTWPIMTVTSALRSGTQLTAQCDAAKIVEMQVLRQQRTGAWAASAAARIKGAIVAQAWSASWGPGSSWAAVRLMAAFARPVVQYQSCPGPTAHE